MRPALLAVLREALSNVARHAHADRVDIGVRAGGGRVTLTVRDNGVGLGGAGPSGGLVNIRRRAEELGGSFTVEPDEPAGTALTWTVPA